MAYSLHSRAVSAVPAPVRRSIAPADPPSKRRNPPRNDRGNGSPSWVRRVSSYVYRVALGITALVFGIGATLAVALGWKVPPGAWVPIVQFVIALPVIAFGEYLRARAYDRNSVRPDQTDDVSTLIRLYAFKDPEEEPGPVWQPVGRAQAAAKRVLDVVAASTALVVLAPIFSFIAVAIKLDSPGPILFYTRRIGRNGRELKLLKFRTMHTDAHARLQSMPLLLEHVGEGYHLPTSLDPRLTRIGRVLRRTSLDELPQLFSVLFGGMSLVGPRPMLPEEAARLPVSQRELIQSVRPGVTGAAQLRHHEWLQRDDARSIDADYARRWSIWTDIKILVRTALAVFLVRNDV